LLYDAPFITTIHSVQTTDIETDATLQHKRDRKMVEIGVH